MKAAIKRFLQKKGWYEYIRYSYPFFVYSTLFKRQVLKDHRKEVAFYKSFLNPCSLIFDIGAYDGHKTAAFLELADKVVSCEPDGNNFRILQVRFRNQRSRVILENKALSDHTGKAVYYIHHVASAFNTLNPKWKQILEQDKGARWNEEIHFSGETTVQLTTLDQLIDQYGVPAFIKIDVEGYEKWVIRGLSRKIPFISFECLLPDCKKELITCLDHLRQLDPQVCFNVAYEEKLLFNVFIDYTELIKWTETVPFYSFEVIAKMSKV